MDNNLSELSKPVGYFIDWQDEETGEKEWCECSKQNGAPLYSQEYVSALEQKIAELEQAMRHIHGAALDITIPRAAIAKAAELAVEYASMKE